MCIFFLRDVFKTQPAEVMFSLNANHVIASLALFNRGVTFRAAFESAVSILCPLLVVHKFPLVDTPAFKAHDSIASWTHCVFGATTFRFCHNRVAVRNGAPLEVASVISDLHIFLLVLPHIHDSLVTKAFKVRNFKLFRAFFL